MLHKANSSSCGWSQPAAMLSIGRRAGKRKFRHGFIHQPDTRKWFGAKQAYVSGNVCRGSQHQQLVQQRRARTPMADHENRIVLRSSCGRSSARTGATSMSQRKEVDEAQSR